MAIIGAIRQWGQALLSGLAAAAGDIIRFIPGLVAAALAVGIAWIAGKILERLTFLLLESVNFDEMLARGPVDRESAEPVEALMLPTRIISIIVFWASFFFLGLAPAADLLGVGAARALIERIIDFIPLVIAALLAVVAAVFIGFLLRDLIRSVAAVSKLPFGRELAWVGFALLAIFGLGVALQVLRVTTPVITAVLVAIGATTGLALAIGFGVGARDVFGALAAGRELRDRLAEGDEVTVESYSGKVERVGLAAVQLRTAQGLVTIPNHVFIQKVVTKKASPPRRAA